MATKKFSRGDTNKDGLIFFKYYGNKEKWLSKEEFLIEKQKELERSRRPHVAERKRKRSRESYHKNKLREKERKAKFYQENKEKIKKRNRDYDKNNRQKINERKNKYRKQRRKENPLVLIAERLRSRVNKFIKRGGYKKIRKTERLIGCSWEELKLWIESFFNERINWSNRNEWHIDHKIPLSSAKNNEELEKLCHYSNLQPLLAIDNLRKNNRIIYENK